MFNVGLTSKTIFANLVSMQDGQRETAENVTQSFQKGKIMNAINNTNAPVAIRRRQTGTAPATPVVRTGTAPATTQAVRTGTAPANQDGKRTRQTTPATTQAVRTGNATATTPATNQDGKRIRQTTARDTVLTAAVNDAKTDAPKVKKMPFNIEGYTTKSAFIAAKLEGMKADLAKWQEKAKGSEVFTTIAISENEIAEVNGVAFEYAPMSVRVIKTATEGTVLEIISETPCKRKPATSIRRLGAVQLNNWHQLDALATALDTIATEFQDFDFDANSADTDAQAAKNRVADLRDKLAQERHKLETQWVQGKALHTAKR